MILNILRSGSLVVEINIDEKTIFKHSLMGEHKIVAEFFHGSALPVLLGDYIEYKGTQYSINTTPEVDKINNVTYRYKIVFEAPIYSLYNKILLDEGSNEFTYFGTADDFVQLILSNINSIKTGWTKGTVDSTEEKYISFENESCREALTKIAKEFGFEYIVNDREINLTLSVGNVSSLVFEYGRGKGLYSLSRKAVQDKNVITRVYGFGGTRNIDYNYRNGKKRLIFEDIKLEANVSAYGIREASITFEDIYPRRTGSVTAVNVSNIFEFTDSSIDFDLNDYLMEGLVAKVVFKTGSLSGYEFEIVSYNHSTKKVSFKVFKDTNDYALPNSLNKPEVGDTYTFVDIKMPQSYIDDAETTLEAKTLEYLNENKNPRVSYDLVIDEHYARSQGISINIGDRVQVVDSQLSLSTQIRVTDISYPLVNDFKVTIRIADFIPYTIQEKAFASTVNSAKVIKRVDRTVSELARRNAALNSEFLNLVFDQSGNYYSDKISPETIETIALQVGQNAQNFNLNDVTIEANKDGNANKIAISGGKLIHYTYSIEGLGFEWVMSAYSNSSLSTGVPYYLYAKCSKTALSGTWILSQSQILVDDVAGFWHFGVGILYSVKDGKRDFDFSKGMTYISGDTITTGRIKSLDALNYFDLIQNKFNLGNAQSGIDWNVANSGMLTIRGGIVQNSGGIEGVISLYRGNYLGNTLYYYGDEVSYSGNTYFYKYSTPTQNNLPTNTTYWTVKVTGSGDEGPQGAAGPFASYRGEYNSGTTYLGTAQRVEIVKYGSVYYVTNQDAGSFSNILPTVTSKWTSIGGNFESIATGLLLAQLAYIENLGVKYLRTSDTGRRIEIYAGDNSIALYNNANQLAVLIRDQIVQDYSGNNSGGIIAYNPSDPGNRFSMVSGFGIRSEGSREKWNEDTNPEVIHNASIVGKLKERNNTNGGHSAAVVGMDETTTGVSNSWGGFFNTIWAGGIHLKVKGVSSSYTCDSKDTYLIISNFSALTITLPSSPKPGKLIIMKKRYAANVVINGNGKQIYANENPSPTAQIQTNAGDGAWFIYNGVAWDHFRMPRY